MSRLLPLTLFGEKRSNPKPKDYKLNQITSKRYKPQLVKDNYVTLCASFHDILEQGYRIFPFEIYRATNHSMEKHDGIFTSYNEIEGKTFKILDIELSDAEVEKIQFLHYSLKKVILFIGMLNVVSMMDSVILGNTILSLY